ncbi:hypothetical protein [Streptomyces incanus]|uniref:Uncharacterized protein n=1 Tax=Streptomyces incanus TaxID=887453 RepID=A0ABW0XIC1_9ACTN
MADVTSGIEAGDAAVDAANAVDGGLVAELMALALVGLVRACVEHRASVRGRTSRPHAVVGGVRPLLGATAAILYVAFLATRPDLALQE